MGANGSSISYSLVSAHAYPQLRSQVRTLRLVESVVTGQSRSYVLSYPGMRGALTPLY